jgi:hypothetical protein
MGCIVDVQRDRHRISPPLGDKHESRILNTPDRRADGLEVTLEFSGAKRNMRAGEAIPAL